MLGSKLWFPFMDETNWDDKIRSLIKELAAVGVHPASSQSPIRPFQLPQLAPPPTLKTAPSQSTQIKKWTPEEVGKWLQDSNLKHLVPLFQQHNVQGPSLVELHQLLISNQKLAHKTAEKLGVGIGDMLSLFCHLRELA